MQKVTLNTVPKILNFSQYFVINDNDEKEISKEEFFPTIQEVPCRRWQCSGSALSTRCTCARPGPPRQVTVWIALAKNANGFKCRYHHLFGGLLIMLHQDYVDRLFINLVQCSAELSKWSLVSYLDVFERVFLYTIQTVIFEIICKFERKKIFLQFEYYVWNCHYCIFPELIHISTSSA